MAHAVALLDRTMSGMLREALLTLLRALLVPHAAATTQAAAAVALTNGAAFVQVGGIQLAVDIVAGVDSCSFSYQFAPARFRLKHACRAELAKHDVDDAVHRISAQYSSTQVHAWGHVLRGEHRL